MRDNISNNKKQKGIDWQHESQGSEQPTKAPKEDIDPSSNYHVVTMIMPFSFGGVVGFLGIVLRSQMVGA
jgi:hypothetical protein